MFAQLVPDVASAGTQCGAHGPRQDRCSARLQNVVVGRSRVFGFPRDPVRAGSCRSPSLSGENESLSPSVGDGFCVCQRHAAPVYAARNLQMLIRNFTRPRRFWLNRKRPALRNRIKNNLSINWFSFQQKLRRTSIQSSIQFLFIPILKLWGRGHFNTSNKF